ncbi:MAG: hypothetical protein ACM3SY_08200 [Candidatus Omnitrophota bacterium]
MTNQKKHPKELGLKKENEILTMPSAILNPSQYSYLTALPGRGYMVMATNIDPDYSATIDIYVDQQGWLTSGNPVEPGRAVTFTIQQMNGNWVYVQNTSAQPVQGRPSVNFALYAM